MGGRKNSSPIRSHRLESRSGERAEKQKRLQLHPKPSTFAFNFARLVLQNCGHHYQQSVRKSIRNQVKLKVTIYVSGVYGVHRHQANHQQQYQL